MDCKRYKQNYLTKVILGIGFPQILGLNKTNPPSAFQKKIIKRFPYVEVQRGENVSLELNSAKPVVNRTPKIRWEFQSRDQSQKVIVNEETLQIVLDKYTNFDEFFKLVKFIFKEFTEIYDIGVFKIGLRYINEIEDDGNPRDWKDLINESLISIPNEFLEPNDKLTRSMHRLEINEDNYHFVFQFGLFNSDYPSPISRKEFVLDYDCVSTEDLEKKDVFDTIDKFHKVIYHWFDKSIENKLREKMGEE